MKTKRFINGFLLAFSAVMTLLFAACNPEQPENEKENKLHEDPVRAVFTLQEGTLDNASAFDNTPKQSDFKAAATSHTQVSHNRGTATSITNAHY